jgi:hypothetical protein
MSFNVFFQRISSFLLILSLSASIVMGQKDSQPIEVKIENGTQPRARITPADVSRMVVAVNIHLCNLDSCPISRQAQFVTKFRSSCQWAPLD